MNFILNLPFLPVWIWSQAGLATCLGVQVGPHDWRWYWHLPWHFSYTNHPEWADYFIDLEDHPPRWWNRKWGRLFGWSENHSDYIEGEW
jgi:hypothetical protein